jgi:hypothetical protein
MDFLALYSEILFLLILFFSIFNVNVYVYNIIYMYIYKIHGLAEKTDVFMLSSLQQCEDWRGFQDHRYIEHAQELVGNT